MASTWTDVFWIRTGKAGSGVRRPCLDLLIFPWKSPKSGTHRKRCVSIGLGASLYQRWVSEDKEVGRQQGKRRVRKCLDISIAIVIRSEDRSPVQNPLSAKAGGSGSITLVRSLYRKYPWDGGECYQKSLVVVGLYSLSICFCASVLLCFSSTLQSLIGGAFSILMGDKWQAC